MKTKKTYLKICILFIGSIFLWSCEKANDFIVNTDTQSLVAQMKTAFKDQNFKEVIPYNFEVNWNHFKTQYSEDLQTQYYEFTLNYKEAVNPNSLNKNKEKGYFEYYNLFVTVNENNEFTFYTARFYEIIKSKPPKENVFLEATNDFSGLVHLVDKINDIVFAKKVENGKSKPKKFYNKAFKPLDPYKARMRKDCIFILVETYQMTIIFNTDDQGEIQNMNFGSWQLIGTRMEEVCDYDFLPDFKGFEENGGSTGSYKSGDNSVKKITSKKITCGDNMVYDEIKKRCKCKDGYVLNSSGDCVEEDKIVLDNTFTNSVANCAYKLLKNNEQFKQILDKLIPENSKYNVIFKVGDISASGGNTSASYSSLQKDIIVTISKDFVDMGNIVSIAETILHESVHARLYEMVKTLGGIDKLSEFPSEDSEIGKLAACYNKYRNKQFQHEFIWENYVAEIAKATEAIHKLFPDNYNRFHNYMQGTTGYDKNTFYQLVAQAGLSKTSYYKNFRNYETRNNIYYVFCFNSKW